MNVITTTDAYGQMLNQQQVDFGKAWQYLLEVEKYYQGFLGTPGHNPYFYIASRVKPLMDRMREGERSIELHNAIFALKKEAPLVESLALS
ncbi:MAG TPA: hypothetical protein VL854_11955 [Nitrososphaeraceae archaeon]|nr:hypothetical protein [Nitrososphaeraceae archaeon]